MSETPPTPATPVEKPRPSTERALPGRRCALVGVADPRHRALIGPFERRRAGLRPVAVVDPDGVGWTEPAFGVPVPVLGTDDELWDDAGPVGKERPDLVAVALGSEGHPVIARALEHGAQVIAVPPLARNRTELAALTSAPDGALRTVHLWRQHPAARLAVELVGRGSLGTVQGIALTLGTDAVVAGEAEQLLCEAVDLFCTLTGHLPDEVTVPEPALDPETLQSPLVRATADAGPALELWLDPDPEAPARAVQVIGDHGQIEWDVTNGRFVSALAGNDPVVISSGRPRGQSEWVVVEVVRGGLDLGDPLASTRVAVAAREAAVRPGEPVRV